MSSSRVRKLQTGGSTYSQSTGVSLRSACSHGRPHASRSQAKLLNASQKLRIKESPRFAKDDSGFKAKSQLLAARKAERLNLFQQSNKTGLVCRAQELPSQLFTHAQADPYEIRLAKLVGHTSGGQVPADAKRELRSMVQDGELSCAALPADVS